jgi:hypothetical protein
VQAGGDRLRAVQGLGVGRVYLQVVDDPPVDKLRLRGGHPGDPVTPRELAGRGDGCLTPDADPQHLEAAESGLPPLLGRRAADEDLIDDDPGLVPPLSTITWIGTALRYPPYVVPRL